MASASERITWAVRGWAEAVMGDSGILMNAPELLQESCLKLITFNFNSLMNNLEKPHQL
jgi:hypothetical protein